MRLPDTLRSRAFRLALLYMGLFGTSVTVLLAFVYLVAGRYVKSHVDEFVLSEIAMFQADFEVDGPEGVLGLIRERIEADHSGHWAYLYLDPAGRRLAGNIAQWPQQAVGSDGFVDLPARGRGSGGKVRAHEAHLPDGARILVGLNDFEVTEMRAALGRAIGVGLGAMLLLAVGGGLLVTRASMRQVESIARVTQEIMAGDLRRRVPLTGSEDEFDRLGRNINLMLDRIVELMQAVRGITDNIAHDLRLPLARHRDRLEAALRQPPAGEELSRFIGQSIEEVDSILGTFGALLRIANVESGTLRESFAEVDLSAIVRDAEQFFEPIASASGKAIVVDAVPGLRMVGNRDLLFQALANLVDNALKFSPEGRPLQITLLRSGDRARLVVADKGPGVPPQERHKVFQRMYRLDTSRSTPGSGLGLSLVRAVALLHEGDCVIEDNHSGARVVLDLPCLPRSGG